MSDDTLDDELEEDPELGDDDEDGEDEEIVVDDLIDDDDEIVDVVDPEAVVDEVDEDEEDEDADAVPTAKRRKAAAGAGAEDEDEEEEEDDDDIEEDLDTILKDRIKASDDEEEEDEPEEPGTDSSERVAAKTADEFTCPTCFLIVHPRQFGRTGARTCPEGYDRCGAIEQLDKAAKKAARKR